MSDTVAFCHPRDTGGVFVEWFAAGHDIDPRFGAEIPQDSAAATGLVDLELVDALEQLG